MSFEGFEDVRRTELQLDWENAAEAEKRSRHMFAQHGIKSSEVQQEVERVRAGLGTEEDLVSFLESALPLLGATVTRADGALEIDLSEASADLRETAPDRRKTFIARSSLPVTEGQVYLTRTHSLVETVSARILDLALSDGSDASVSRCGVSHTRSVSRPTTAFLVRHRVVLTTTEDGKQHPSLSEYCEFLAVDRLDGEPEWFSDEEVEQMLQQGRLLTLNDDDGTNLLQQTLDQIDQVKERLDERAEAVSSMLLADHYRVREASRRTGVRFKADPASTPDILGIYALMPAPN